MVKDLVRYWTQGWHIRMAFGVVGAGLGYIYYATIGCDGGCPLTGNPWTSTAYGAFVGLLAYPGPKQAPVAATELEQKQEPERP